MGRGGEGGGRYVALEMLSMGHSMGFCSWKVVRASWNIRISDLLIGTLILRELDSILASWVITRVQLFLTLTLNTLRFDLSDHPIRK